MSKGPSVSVDFDVVVLWVAIAAILCSVASCTARSDEARYKYLIEINQTEEK